MLHPSPPGASESRRVYRVQSKVNSESIVPDIIYAALKTISQVSQGCPFPPIAFAAQLVVDVWDKVMEIKQNKTGFRNLAYTAGDIIKTVWDELERQIVESGKQISDSFEQSVDDLSRVVSSIHKLVCDYAGRGWFRRVFCSNKDLEYITEFQQELEQARKSFELVSIVSVRATVERIEQNQRRPGGSSPMHGAFANMTVNNTGGGTFNNVVGNQYNGFANGGRNSQMALNQGGRRWAGTYDVDWRKRGEAMKAKSLTKRARFDGKMHRKIELG
ncbi:hypothetical protein EYR40_004854 [Pleurotus pulmonarius]|nr:hypothetical protein EYR36_006765 [Pleurotus pulmonarius]KAF4601461.1 hypothetical protein EYR38_006114 [Pleurotus pulmonarius]KAF4601655.1 hypothetical protein EYR40_004854 [Pleurotus pulmonarius]